jgi:hypothetical protein
MRTGMVLQGIFDQCQHTYVSFSWHGIESVSRIYRATGCLALKPRVSQLGNASRLQAKRFKAKDLKMP